MAQTTFTGPVKSINGFIGAGVGMPVAFTSGSLTVASHAGKLIKIGSDTDGKITLPTINDSAAGATDDTGLNSGSNIGATFTFFVETACTDLDIKTDGTDKFVGSIVAGSTNATTGAVNQFVPAAANDVITLNGTTKGGAVGSYIKITALDNDKYFVEGVTTQSTSGANVTPFANA
jgi:hypothetical protein